MTNFNHKNFISSLTSLVVVFCLLFSMSQKAVAQDFEFEECPNPDGFSYYFFVDTLDEVMYLSYFDQFTSSATLFTLQNEVFTEIPNPANTFFSQLAGTDGDDLLLVYGENVGFSYGLYKYNGLAMTEIPAPDGFNYSYFVTEVNGLYYFAYYDSNFNTNLFQYDGTSLTQVPTPSGYNFGSYVGELNGDLFFTYWSNLTFESAFFSYDGSDLDEVIIPDGWTFNWVPFSTDDALFISMYDATFNFSLFEFDGVEFTEFAVPDGFTFSYFVTEADGDYFMVFYDAGFNQFLFTYDGTTVEEVPNQPAAPFNAYAVSKNGKHYFSFGNWGVDASLYSYDGTDFTLLPGAPDNAYYGYFVGELESACYMVYWDNNFNGQLVQLQDDALTAIQGPANSNFNQLFVEEDGFVFLSYYDLNTFQSSLYAYDIEESEMIEISLPTGYLLNTFVASFENKLFFSFYDQNTFTNQLFKIELNQAPTSANNTVYLSEDQTFYFADTDFTFVDQDIDDVFSGIQLVTQVDKGVIHLNGAVIEVGDIIPFEDLGLLIYVPLPGETGNPYTSFDFKVFDGDDLSEEAYTMFIVVGPYTGVEEQNLFSSVKMFPNPAVNYLQVELESRENMNTVLLSVYSAAGQLINEEQISSFGQQLTHTLDVSQLPAGQYVLRIIANEQITGSSFIKQ